MKITRFSTGVIDLTEASSHDITFYLTKHLDDRHLNRRTELWKRVFYHIYCTFL